MKRLEGVDFRFSLPAGREYSTKSGEGGALEQNVRLTAESRAKFSHAVHTVPPGSSRPEKKRARSAVRSPEGRFTRRWRATLSFG
jgi:hypothetical protein